MTPEELPGYLAEIRARVEAAAIPVADAIGKTYKEHLVGFTLHESGTSVPMVRTPAPEGRPPAFMPGGLHGSLAGSVTKTPAVGGGGIAETTVAPHTIYAATQEWGGTHYGKPWMYLWIRYLGGDWKAVIRKGWRKHVVKIPERPYMRTAVAETIANGELVRAAEETFEAVVWGR